jgi:hypothetical protein
MTHSTVSEAIQDDHLVRAEEMLDDAQRNPVLSGTQACGVAHVYALLAIEQRLAQLCASVDAALAAIVGLSRPDDETAVATPSLAS